MEDVNNNNSYYGFGEKRVKSENLYLWDDIHKHANFIEIDIFTKFKEKFFLYENKLLEKPLCYCSMKLNFIDMKNGYREFCSRRCMLDSPKVKERRKNTCIKKYGVDNPSKNNEVKNTVKSTNIEKFGVEYPLMSSDVVSRYKNTCIGKYGVDNPSKLKHVRDKAKETMLERYGVEHALQNGDILNNLKITNINKYGKPFYTQTQEYSDRIKHTSFIRNVDMVNSDNIELLESSVYEYIIKCSNCLSVTTIQRQLWRSRIIKEQDVCLNCNPITTNVSQCEKEILNYVKSVSMMDVLENYRINKKEMDVYVPEKSVGIEYNGLYWHSEFNKSPSYHIDKTKSLNDNGIKVIHIWEDQWSNKRDIVKSIISNSLGVLSDKIFSRKCHIRKIIDNNIVREFLNDNHIQGYCVSSIKFGLFYEEELVSIMTFSKKRISVGQKNDNVGEYELIRFCSKKFVNVLGGASKIFKHFIKEYNPRQVMSYSDNSRSGGGVYKTLGFSLFKETQPNYYWCKNGMRYHRFNFRKDKLVSAGFPVSSTEIEIMHGRDYFRVFDCGSKKWIYTL